MQAVCISTCAIFLLTLDYFGCIQNSEFQCIVSWPHYFGQKPRRRNYIIQYKLRNKTVFSLIYHMCRGGLSREFNGQIDGKGTPDLPLYYLY